MDTFTNKELLVMLNNKVEKINDKVEATNIKVGKIEENIKTSEKNRVAFENQRNLFKTKLKYPIIVGLVLGSLTGSVSLIIHFF